MRIFGFAGWSGSGKTTLIEQIIPRIVARGLTVSLVKHAHHRFEVDQPGKDSYRHRHAGCQEVLVTSTVALGADARAARRHRSWASGRRSPGFRRATSALIEGFKTEPDSEARGLAVALGKPLLHPGDATSSASPPTAPTSFRLTRGSGFRC